MEILAKKHYRDQWGGKNYGCYPLKTYGEDLKKRLDNSIKWELITKDEHIDTRNDNQCDIHRGSDFIYRNIETSDMIFVGLVRSRSGKTKDWYFSLTFLGPINF
ncbi:hypothetical protein LRQ09_15530 [Acinetobacter soli]|uniref:hypothetical protein n=1 Tax=Acinetobacter soli TaxID=487316 RepID=UPI001F2DAA13|nr:hypothetical protein [Acinetobacter soli]MCF3128763.1 hypothetical protein [Acinetobacter soli]